MLVFLILYLPVINRMEANTLNSGHKLRKILWKEKYRKIQFNKRKFDVYGDHPSTQTALKTQRYLPNHETYSFVVPSNRNSSSNRSNHQAKRCPHSYPRNPHSTASNPLNPRWPTNNILHTLRNPPSRPYNSQQQHLIKITP